jgi:PBP1b-binding outer membrane lipoprotein LpoB
MKNILIIIAALIFIAGCSATRTNTSSVNEQTIGSVQITYDDSGNWIKIVSSGMAPLHNSSAHATSEATKVAAMHANQNIADFMSSNIQSDKTVDTESTSNVRSGRDHEKSDGEINTLTAVIEHIKDNSTAILRGIQITNQSVSREFVRVEVTATKQSIVAAQLINSSMNSTNQ